MEWWWVLMPALSSVSRGSSFCDVVLRSRRLRINCRWPNLNAVNLSKSRLGLVSFGTPTVVSLHLSSGSPFLADGVK